MAKGKVQMNRRGNQRNQECACSARPKKKPAERALVAEQSII